MTTMMSKRPPTARQLEVLAYVRDYRNVNGYCASVRDVCDHFGFGSANAAMCHLWPLRRKGLVTWEEGQSRTLRVVEVANGE